MGLSNDWTLLVWVIAMNPIIQPIFMWPDHIFKYPMSVNNLYAVAVVAAEIFLAYWLSRGSVVKMVTIAALFLFLPRLILVWAANDMFSFARGKTRAVKPLPSNNRPLLLRPPQSTTP